ASWVSAVGADAFGRAVTAAVSAHGVDVSGVLVDPSRPTGLYIKESSATGTRVRYYRAGSAASAMTPALLRGVDLDGPRIIHVSGITAALSPGCRDLMRALAARPRTNLLSFDLNWRAPLWTDSDPAILLELASTADIVLAGDDEAHAVWGVS